MPKRVLNLELSKWFLFSISHYSLLQSCELLRILFCFKRVLDFCSLQHPDALLEAYGTLILWTCSTPNCGPAEAWSHLVVAIPNLPKCRLGRETQSAAGAGWPLIVHSLFLLAQCFSSNRTPALEVLHFISFIKLMLGRILGSAQA